EEHPPVCFHRGSGGRTFGTGDMRLPRKVTERVGMKNRSKFYDSLRKSALFGPRLSQPQVTGIEAILDACFRHRVDDPHHVCYILANVYRETGGYMFPIKETVYASHKDKNPSDKTVIARLDKAFKAGK